MDKILNLTAKLAVKVGFMPSKTLPATIKGGATVEEALTLLAALPEAVAVKVAMAFRDGTAVLEKPNGGLRLSAVEGKEDKYASLRQNVLLPNREAVKNALAEASANALTIDWIEAEMVAEVAKLCAKEGVEFAPSMVNAVTEGYGVAILGELAATTPMAVGRLARAFMEGEAILKEDGDGESLRLAAAEDRKEKYAALKAEVLVPHISAVKAALKAAIWDKKGA